jgi:hypothetical protein
MPVRRLAAEARPLGDGTLGVRAWTRNVERLDAFLDGRPAGPSLDVADGARDFAVPLPPQGAAVLELRGYADGELAASTRVRLGT